MSDPAVEAGDVELSVPDKNEKAVEVAPFYYRYRWTIAAITAVVVVIGLGLGLGMQTTRPFSLAEYHI